MNNTCAAPWSNLHISLRGDFKPCCGGKGEFGNIRDDAWTYTDGTNNKLKTLKQSLIDNVDHPFCNNCYEKGWYDEFFANTKVDDVNKFELKSVDVRWGTTCQLSCTYCDETNSSTWQKLKSNRIIPIQSSRTFKNKVDDLISFINQNKDTIIRVNLAGGEPLLLKENVEFLKVLPPHIRIEVITNLNVELDSNPVYQQLLKKDWVSWNVSMENIGQRFEFVRRGASWELQVNNLHKLEQDSKGTNSSINIHSLYHIYSALNLLEMFEFVEQFEHLNLDWVQQELTKPSVLNIFNYPVEYKQLAIKEIDLCAELFPNNHVSNSALQTIKNKLRNSITDVPGIVQRCINFHQQQESQYLNNQFNFLELWPQFNIK